jgi:tol-pal system protein YbgF
VNRYVMLLTLVASSGGLAGCVSAASKQELADLRKRMDGYRRQAERDHKNIDELENRVFVLEDKVDTQQVSSDKAGEDAPRLPVVKKSAPAGNDAAADEDGNTVSDRYTDENGEDVVVVYEGDAARKGPSRPKIKLYEGSGGDDMTPVDEPAARSGAPRARRGRGKQVADAGADDDRLPVQKQVPPPPAAGAPSGAEDPVTLYKASYQSLTRREHAASIAGFERFLELFPEHDYADNAQYWLAEAYYDQRDWKTALAEFRKVVKRYPDGNKAPDALLKIGYCYAKLGDLDSARDVLTQVIEIYPKTEAARLAEKRLDEMRPQ